MLCLHQVLCPHEPFLPAQRGAFGMPPEAALLDRQFRLLREDFVGLLREEAREGRSEDPRKPKGYHMQYEGVSCDGNESGIVISFELPPSHEILRLRDKDERIRGWKPEAQRVLPQECAGADFGGQ